MSKVCQFLLKASFAIAILALLSMLVPISAYADGPFKVEYSSDPGNPEATKASNLTIRVYDASGKAVTNAKVTVTADMPANSMSGMSMSSMQPLKLEAKSEGKDGEYVVRPTFSMTGKWDIKVDVEAASGKSSQSFTLDVVDPKPLTGINWPIIGGIVVLLVIVVSVPVALRSRGKGKGSKQKDVGA